MEGAIDAKDYDPALRVGIGMLSSTPAAGERVLDVTRTVQEAWQRRMKTMDFRLNFERLTDKDVSVDIAFFNDASDKAGNGQIPTLVVIYTLD